jgi:hypothetical protein
MQIETRRSSIQLFLADANASSEVVRLFKHEGVVAIRRALAQSVCEQTVKYLSAALEDISEVFGRYNISLNTPDCGTMVERLLDDNGQSVPAEDRHMLLGHFPLSVRLGEALWEIPLHLARHAFMYEILGAKRLFVHMPPTARFVLPGNVKAAVPAHQDVSYNKHLRSFCVVWVPLVEIDAMCGGMALFPRTQGRGELFRGQSVAPVDGWIPAVDTSDLERVEFQPLSPGDIVVMGEETVHESMPNRSPGIRLSVDFRFFGDNSSSTKHYLDINERCVIAPIV